MKWRYNAFGLNIESEIELPNLCPASDGPVELTIRVGEIDVASQQKATALACYSQCNDNTYWFHPPEIAEFQVRDGNEVIVAPDPDADPQSIRLFLLGSAIGAVMHQRGQLVMHANAIQFGSKCVMFSAVSGNGKSTLAAAFHQKGYPVLSDDLVVIDAEGRAYPSYPQLKLWQDTANMLRLDTSKLTRIRLQVEKFAYPLSEGFCSTPLDVAAMYILQTHNRDEILLDDVKGFAKFNPIKNHTYRTGIMKGLGLQKRHLKLCSTLANRITTTHVTRPNAGHKLDDLVARIEADLREKGVL